MREVMGPYTALTAPQARTGTGLDLPLSSQSTRQAVGRLGGEVACFARESGDVPMFSRTS